MTRNSSTRLELWDYVSLSSVVTVSLIVGLYHIYTTRKSKVTKDFLASSHELGIFPLILSMVATFYSAIGMLGLPRETYTNGISYMWVALAFVLPILLGIFLYIPVFYKLNRMSIFEYLEMRFNVTVRTMASVIMSLQTLLYTACVIYAPALALNQVTGLHLWTSVVSVGGACILYTSMGGIKAVVWADVTQCLVMIAVLLIILIKGIINVGGLDIVWQRLKDGKRDEIVIWSSSPYSQYSIWTMIIGATSYFTANLNISQAYMQRYLSNRTLRRAQLSMLGGSVGIMLGQILIAFCGLLLYAKYYQCDPLLSGQINKTDQLMALFAMDTLSFCHGLPGVFVAGILCACLSTMSSTLNSLTAVTLSDYIKPLKPNMSDEVAIKLSKLLAIVYGGLCIALVAIVERVGGVLTAVFSIGGLTGGPVLTLYTIGMLFPWVNSKCAMIAFGASIIIPWWAWLGNLLTSPPLNHAPFASHGCTNVTINVTNITGIHEDKSFLQQFYAIHSMWYTFWSLISGLTVALVTSRITGFQDPKQVDPDLLFSFMKKYGASKSNIIKELGHTVDTNGHAVHAFLITDNSAKL